MKIRLNPKSLLLDLAMIVATSAIGFPLGWWSITIPAFARGALMPSNAGWTAFRTALAAGIAWFGLALYQDALSGFRISARMGAVLHLPMGLLLYFVIFFIAAVLSGLASLFGAHLTALIRSYVRTT
jgi:hypothetical protein